jgi:hypothetical protein
MTSPQLVSFISTLNQQSIHRSTAQLGPIISGLLQLASPHSAKVRRSFIITGIYFNCPVNQIHNPQSIVQLVSAISSFYFKISLELITIINCSSSCPPVNYLFYHDITDIIRLVFFIFDGHY